MQVSRALQMVDPLYVIETCVRYFYSLAQTGRKANAPLDEVCRRQSQRPAPDLGRVNGAKQATAAQSVSAK
jgi:hypothetical protein